MSLRLIQSFMSLCVIIEILFFVRCVSCVIFLAWSLLCKTTIGQRCYNKKIPAVHISADSEHKRSNGFGREGFGRLSQLRGVVTNHKRKILLRHINCLE